MFFEKQFNAAMQKAADLAQKFSAWHSQESAKRLKCDVLLFVATSSEEDHLKEAALELGLQFKKTKGQNTSGRTLKYFDIGQVGTYKVKAVRCNMGPFSFDGSAARALMAQAETQATALISLGMAFGTDRTSQNFGDVLISNSLLPYDARKVTCRNGEINDLEDVHPYPAKPSLVNMLRIYHDQVNFESRVEFGPMLTGGARIQCATFRDKLSSELSERGVGRVIGGEMEGAGLMATCRRDSPNWVLVKGISDFADDHRDDEIDHGRPIACRNSARFVLSALLAFNPENQ
jgi:adenosylhomocysteine nucleosidase